MKPASGTERRRAPRYNLALPLRLLTVNGRNLRWSGVTRNIGPGGIRFRVQDELPVGKEVDYILTLSDHLPAAHIRCSGVILRCGPIMEDALSDVEGPLWDVAASMERYVFAPQEDAELAAV